MKKFRLTNSIENPTPSAKNLMYLSNAISKWQWLFLILILTIVGIGFYHIGKYVGKQSKSKPKKKYRIKLADDTENRDQDLPSNSPDTSSINSSE